MSTVSLYVQLESQTCPACGIVFGVPQWRLDHLRQHGGSYYCPNGHSLNFGQCEVDRLKREVAVERQRRDQAEAKARESERLLKAAEAKAANARRRAKHGVCPCCSRTFRQLARHMAAKHPSYGG